jgi:hypothetical protein
MKPVTDWTPNDPIEIANQILLLAQQVGNLRASVNTLKVSLATEMNRADPQAALALFEKIEKRFLDADPTQRERTALAEAIAALQEWRKLGGGRHEA